MPVIENKNSNIKVGTVSAFPTNTIIPEGWLICNGAILNKNDFPDLFSVIGYTYGGSGNSFNVPNLQGRFIRGYGTDPADGNRHSTNIGQYQPDCFRSHNHSMYMSWGGGGHHGGYGSVEDGAFIGYNTNYCQGAGDVETRPVNMPMIFCIKY